jgi:hypothetical protein
MLAAGNVRDYQLLTGIFGDLLVKSANSKFQRYREQWPARDPDLSRMRFEDETNDLSGHHDVSSLELAPAERWLEGEPAAQPRSSGKIMHLWLIHDSDVVVALEEGDAGASTKRGRLAHSNLTSSGRAHSGGELWFRDASSVWITGGSSRYTPRCREELEAVSSSLKDCDYSVCNCGWDDEINSPSRFFRGEYRWV